MERKTKLENEELIRKKKEEADRLLKEKEDSEKIKK